MTILKMCQRARCLDEKQRAHKNHENADDSTDYSDDYSAHSCEDYRADYSTDFSTDYSGGYSANCRAYYSIGYRVASGSEDKNCKTFASDDEAPCEPSVSCVKKWSFEPSVSQQRISS